MTGIAISAFRGEVPKRSERLLAENYAQSARNCKISSGRIDPIKGLQLVHTSLAASIASMYRYRHQDLYNWLVFDGIVDVSRSPVVSDSLGRFYFTGDGEPRMSTYADAITGAGPYPVGWYVLGVTSPVTAMSIAVTGGVGANEDRAYVYTFKTAYGEESGPSPATLKTGKVDGSWDITGMDAAPPNSGTISAAVKDTPLPGQVEVTLDTVFGLAAHEEVTFAGVSGMTDLNGTFALVSVDSATNKVVVALETTQTYSAGTDTWARVAPHNTMGMKKCIYRTVGTNTDYKLVTEIAVATTSYSDTIPAATVSLNAGITTLDTLPPPKNMHSLVLLANNALAGLAGNEFCISEQGKPYSWPTSNRYSFPGTGIALSATGNSAIILTDGFPHVATATVPEAASISKIPGEMLAPCVSKRGVVDTGSGALYPSHDGLYLATPGGVVNLTATLFTLAEWQTMMPATFKAAFFDGMYLAEHQTSTTNRILMINIKEPDSITECDETADAIYSNPWDGHLYIGKANKIFQWDADNTNRYVAVWKSKEHQLGRPQNLSVAQVHANYDELVEVNNDILNANTALLADVANVNGEIACAEVGVYEVAASAILPVPVQTAGYVQFTLIRDGVSVFSKLVTSSAPFRLPPGKKSDRYTAQIASSVGVHSINMAQGMEELRSAA